MALKKRPGKTETHTAEFWRNSYELTRRTNESLKVQLRQELEENERLRAELARSRKPRKRIKK